MGKKKKKDFWGISAEDQLAEQNRLTELEERGEVNIFSLGKIPKVAYTGIESEIADDINRTFSRNNNKIETGVKYEVLSDTEISSDFVDESNVEEQLSLNQGFMRSHLSHALSRANSLSKRDISLRVVVPDPIITRRPMYVSFYSSAMSVYYKVSSAFKPRNLDMFNFKGIDHDEIYTLLKYMATFKYPSALFTLDEFNDVMDKITGTFKKGCEMKYIFIDFDDYVAAYYMDMKSVDYLYNFYNDPYNPIRSDIMFMDTIITFVIESLNTDIAITYSDFDDIYNTDFNKENKEIFINLLKNDLEESSEVLFVDVELFSTIFDKGEKLFLKYVYEKEEENEEESSIDNDIDEALTLSHDEHEFSSDNLNEDDSDDNDDEDDDEDNDEEDDNIIQESDVEISIDENDYPQESNIDSMMDEAFTEEEKSSEDSKTMTIPVTRKTHP